MRVFLGKFSHFAIMWARPGVYPGPEHNFEVLVEMRKGRKNLG